MTALAGLALAVIAVIAVIALHGGSSGSSTSPTPAAAPGKPAAPAGPSDHDGTIPTAAPPVAWDNVNGLSVPDGGAQFGPVHIDDVRQLYTGYAHTPRGALVTLLDIDARSTIGNWRATANAQLTGPGKPVWQALRATTDDSVPPGGWCQRPASGSGPTRRPPP